MYQRDYNMGNIVELTNGPLILKGAVLMSAGTWNNVYYAPEDIERAFKETDWTSREKTNLFLDHKDYEVGEWIGNAENIYFKNDTLYGDLVIHDPIWAHKMKFGKPKVGISPKIKGMLDEKSHSMHDCTFENFSLVINPAVKKAFINNMEELQMEDVNEILESDIDDLEKQKDEEAIKKKKYPKPQPYPEGMSEEEVLAAAKDILKKKKKDVVPTPAEDTGAMAENMEDVMDLFEIFELKGQNVASIMKKAKAIRKEGEPWKAAMKRASKSMEDEILVAKDMAVKSEAESKLKEKLEEMSKQVKTLSDKLYEPETRTVTKMAEARLSDREIDMGFLQTLKELDKQSEVIL